MTGRRTTSLAMWVCAALVILPLAIAGADEKKKKTPSVTGLYKLLDLSPEQVTQIDAIQQETKEKIAALKAAERESILGTLTDAQREKLAAIEAERAAKRKEKQQSKKKSTDEAP